MTKRIHSKEVIRRCNAEFWQCHHCGTVWKWRRFKIGGTLYTEHPHCLNCCGVKYWCRKVEYVQSLRKEINGKS